MAFLGWREFRFDREEKCDRYVDFPCGLLVNFWICHFYSVSVGLTWAGIWPQGVWGGRSDLFRFGN